MPARGAQSRPMVCCSGLDGHGVQNREFGGGATSCVYPPVLGIASDLDRTAPGHAPPGTAAGGSARGNDAFGPGPAPCWSVRSARRPAGYGASYAARALAFSSCLPVSGRRSCHAGSRSLIVGIVTLASGRPGPAAWGHPVACCEAASGVSAVPRGLCRAVAARARQQAMTRFLWTGLWMSCAKWRRSCGHAGKSWGFPHGRSHLAAS